MPTISIFHKDLELLLHQRVKAQEVENWLPLVKGELKDHNPSTGEFRIELQDSNRPDLWCVEGIARQIRIALSEGPLRYPFISTKHRSKFRVRVSPGMENVRPYIAVCTASGYTVTEEGLTQFIQTQEKMSDIFGHKRRTVSIGLYRLKAIRFPITYGLVKPEEGRFTPLGFEEKMNLREILSIHPKGIEFGPILTGCDHVPLLWANDGQVLSFPPIINSKEIGEVQVGDDQLLVEVTGTDFRMVNLTLTIFAANLADRGATIEPAEIMYPYATEFGKTIRTPLDFGQALKVPIHTIEKALGQPLGAEAIQQALAGYGYEVKASRHKLAVKLPPYRNDLMHPVDVAEDVAIKRGYNSFAPMMPAQFTVGALTQLESSSDHIRDLLVGFGFQEIFSNILMAREELIDRMRIQDTEFGKVVEIDNVMSQTFSCLRSSMIPSLLRVEAASARAFYPHQLFEIGEVARQDLSEELGSRTLITLGALIAHPTANFSEVHTYLDQLFFHLVRSYTLEPIQHPSFLSGRVGKITCQGKSVGHIGELHPEVLEQWQIGMPVAVFELEVNSLTQAEIEKV